MNNWIFNAYSDAYGTALMQDVKPVTFVAGANRAKAGKFSALVRLLARA